MKNIPYVKKYNEDGKVANPIIGNYPQPHPNRKQNRYHKNVPPFVGNGKNHHMTCDGKNRYDRVLQIVINKDGDKKKIYHYILK